MYLKFIQNSTLRDSSKIISFYLHCFPFVRRSVPYHHLPPTLPSALRNCIVCCCGPRFRYCCRWLFRVRVTPAGLFASVQTVRTLASGIVRSIRPTSRCVHSINACADLVRQGKNVMSHHGHMTELSNCLMYRPSP